MPPPGPLALAVWPEGVEKGTAAIVSVTGGMIGSGPTTVIATGTGDTGTVDSEYYVDTAPLSSLLLTLYHSVAVNAVVLGPPTDAGINPLLPPSPFRWISVHICML